jgi:antitoxin YefM
MQTMSASEFRNNLAAALDRVTDNLEEIVITRAGHEPVVVVSLREYESLEETAYLLGNAANARHLAAGIAEHRAGGGAVHDPQFCATASMAIGEPMPNSPNSNRTEQDREAVVHYHFERAQHWAVVADADRIHKSQNNLGVQPPVERSQIS